MSVIIRNAEREEHLLIGQMMVEVYSKLEGFPSPKEQPAYYEKLANVGQLTESKNIKLFVAEEEGQVLGAVVYIDAMQEYGSGGTALSLKGAGFRLLAVSPEARGKGLGKTLAKYCIQQARKSGHDYLYIHTTEAMKLAWGMYERLGFERYEYLDFIQKGFPVYGFRLVL